MKNLLTDIFGNKKERTDFLISIFVVLIFISTIVYYIFQSENKLFASDQMAIEFVDSKDEVLVKKKLAELAQVVNVDEELEETESDSKSIFDKIKKQETTATTINPSNSTATEEELEEAPEIILETEDQEEEASVMELEEANSTESEEEIEAIINEVEEIEEDTLTTDPKEYNISPSNKNITDDKEATTNITEGSNYGCIVIVGAFKEKKNADDLQVLIKNKAYPVYRGINKGYFVVGVNSSCDKKLSIPLLNQLKKEFNSAAWIYKR